MILTCPTCTTRFLLPAHLLEPEGRDVKCSRCGEVWHELPDSDELIAKLEGTLEDIPESVRPVPEGSEMPAIRSQAEQTGDEDRSHAVATGYAVATVFFVLFLGMLVLSKDPLVLRWPKMAALYEVIGIEVISPGEGVEFDRVMANLDNTGQLNVEGMLVNLKSRDQALPMIEAIIKDDQGAEIWRWAIEPPADTIAKEETLPFTASFSNMPDEADSLHLHMVLISDAPRIEHVEEAVEHETPADQHEAPVHESHH